MGLQPGEESAGPTEFVPLTPMMYLTLGGLLAGALATTLTLLFISTEVTRTAQILYGMSVFAAALGAVWLLLDVGRRRWLVYQWSNEAADLATFLERSDVSAVNTDRLEAVGTAPTSVDSRV